MTIKHKLLGSVSLSLALLVIVLILCTAKGTTDVPLKSALSILAAKAGFSSANTTARAYEIILLDIRLPRVLLASTVGGGLAIVGCVMQAIFKNPMAEPGVLGWSSGGGLVAVVVMYSGLADKYFFSLPAGAFIGTLLAAFIVYRIASQDGHTPTTTLLLSGIAVGAFFASLTTLVLTIANVWSMREMLFWLMGGFDSRSWIHLLIAFPPVAIGSLGIMFFTRDLNAVLLGEDSAKTLGVDVERTKSWLIVLSSLVVGACVSVSGVIGFVGLIIPHIMRLIVGADHRVLLPLSFLVGATFLPIADLVARTALKPEELRLGVITSCVGVPFFLYLLRKNRRGMAGI